ncbi:MAG: branched-chain amino acid ABC transporter ATP-binding protein/permease [Rhodoplanes sp.]|uniref:branched-chain amino acid ABC transporter ATP-binding protein/permease n=1 Tax=Rhodoplanes sp. TaxID=1968906 RepID=UPI00180F801A|nr:branched-chain amino acid ABC transporter ATP-binding protein/permease [Rhodoplanes sp.]NVO14474.1 branched-chain amino acid ABC transporter ATP-binding protein/permease [Rhodoplanes sp.]
MHTASSRKNILIAGGVAALAVLGAAVVAPSDGYYLNIMMQAATYTIAVAGLVIVLGYCGQIALCQAAFLGIGAYCVALGTVDYGLPFFVALAIGVVVSGVTGIFLGFATLRLGGHYLAMVTIGFQMIVTMVLTNWIGFTHGPDGIPGIPRPSLGLVDLKGGSVYLGLCLVVLVAVTVYAALLKQSRLGRAMQAVRDNEIAASTCGINIFRTKTVAFGICAALGGLGGGLFAGAFSYISPDQFTFNEAIVLLTMALLGGVESAIGAVIGTILLVLLPEWLRFLRQAYLAVYGGAVIAIMIFMPRGVWGLVVGRFVKSRPLSDDATAPLPLLARTGEVSDTIVLDVTGLAKHFGGLKAVDGVDLAVRKGSVHALIGPNGSGKTTMLNVITGLYVATAGRVRLGGRDITELPPHDRNRLGMCRTYQNIRVFRGLTVLENVVIGAERAGNDVSGTDATVERAIAALDFVGLRQVAHLPVGDLPYGHQRYVEIARALAGSPEILLLDEPAAGLNLTEKGEMAALLKRLKGHGTTIVIIDHDMRLIEKVADHITVLNFGRRIADGDPRSVFKHPEVVAAYLGEARHEAA